MDFHHEGREGREGTAKESDCSREIIGCGMKVHSALGPGLLESIYEECLCHELKRVGLVVRRQVECPIIYDNFRLSARLRLDLLVEDTVIVEVKAVDRLLPVHDAQLLSYLRLAGKPLGLLLNFNTVHFRHGIRRRVLS